jgi:hypothetical protein
MRTVPVVSSAVVVGLAVLALAARVAAQTSAPEPPKPAPATSSSSTEQFGLNLGRIQRGLQKSSDRQDFEGLNLKYYVSVYAPAPPIKLFTPLDNLLYGQAPYGGPTHSDMLQVMTPKEYRAPVADFSGLARWLANKARK